MDWESEWEVNESPNPESEVAIQCRDTESGLTLKKTGTNL